MTNDDLFVLIKSLSRAEKRYFTVNANAGRGGKEPSYLQLFKLMNDLEEYDDAKLKKYFPKNLSWEKNNLYKLILRSMRNFRSDKSAYARIKEMIIDVQFLMERGLFEQAYKLLNKCKKLAIEYDQKADLLSINELERIALFRMQPKDLDTKIDLLIEAQQKIQSEIGEEFTMANAYASISSKV